jgi:hypothetical protein
MVWILEEQTHSLSSEAVVMNCGTYACSPNAVKYHATVPSPLGRRTGFMLGDW